MNNTILSRLRTALAAALVALMISVGAAAGVDALQSASAGSSAECTELDACADDVRGHEEARCSWTCYISKPHSYFFWY